MSTSSLKSDAMQSLGSILLLDFEQFRETLKRLLAQGSRTLAFFGIPGEPGALQLLAVLAHEGKSEFEIFSTIVGERYPSLTPECPQLHLFEREISENWGVVPEGHPWLAPVRASQERFFSVEGDEVHEVAVGPVHAGIIEPGHFRFQCHGETVMNLEIALGYQHRGIERALLGGPSLKTLPLMQVAAGDTTIGHSLAYAQVIEGLSGIEVSERAERVRAIALELERIANHTGDLGALAGDVGFLPTASYCGRLRGDILNMTALLCGNRFGRGLVVPGGVGYDLDDALISELLGRLKKAERDLKDAVELLFRTPSVLARFHEAGYLTPEMANELGLVGLAARGCGLKRDARHEYPTGFYKTEPMPMATWETGGVYARTKVRWMEIQHSIDYIRQALKEMPAGEIRETQAPLGSDGVAIALVEGWRGEICHVAITDERGRFKAYKIVDPSFHNWSGLATAMRDQEISDFPLCNKSFNLSYCGFDL